MLSWNICACILTIGLVLCGLTNARLKRGRYPQFNDFCNGKDVYVGVPWDCSGYIHCQSGNGIKMTFWIECPASLYFSLKHKTCMWPEHPTRPCPHVKDVVEAYCPQYPRSKLVHEDNCARYYDCSDFGSRKQPYLKECPFPQLFNPDTLTCDDYKYVECENRYRPVTPCDYSMNKCVGADCPPCESRQEGCEGQPDGPAVYPGRLLTEYYLICRNSTTSSIKTCKDHYIFDPIQGVCTLDLDPMALDVYCASSVDARIAHPRICSRYYDCKLTRPRENFKKFEGECRYPLLYSERYRRCIDFADVQCGGRIEPKGPCEYGQNRCFGPNCGNQDCQTPLPSCLTLQDGANPHPGDASKYIICRMERTIEVRDCPAGETYSSNQRGCSGGGRGKPSVQPVRPPIGPPIRPPIGPVISPVRPPVITEPPIRPPVQPPTEPPIGPTIPPIGPPVRPPVKPPIRPPIAGTPCAGNPFGIFPDPSHCARYYNCTQRFQIPGLDSFQSECPYPQLYDESIRECNDFPAVNCGSRPEAMSPCDYITTLTSCFGESCNIPCEERSPSCVGRMDGNNTFPGRDLTPFYMHCMRNRTLSVGICKYGVYDPTKKYCTTDLDPYSVEVFCRDKPNIRFPHIANCARYYDCSATQPDPIFGRFQRECTYPTLFNIDRLKCVSPSEGDCQWRFEPKEICGFLGNQKCDAAKKDCGPCLDTLTICAGIPNGNVAIDGNRMEYAVCQRGRFSNTKSCAPYSFSRETNDCVYFDNECDGKTNGRHSRKISESEFVVCFNGNVKEFGSCNPLVFDPITGACSEQRPIVKSIAKSKCDGLADGRYPAQTISQFIECKNGKDTLKNCKRDRMFDSVTGKCIKPEFLCRGLTDGNYGHENGRDYFECVNGQLTGKQRCKHSVFDYLEGKCHTDPCRINPNGRSIISGSDTTYVECHRGQVHAVASCGLMKYDDQTGTCTKSVSFCFNKANGWHQMSDIYIYMYCMNEKPARSLVCPAEVFDAVTGVCYEGFIPSEPVAFCEMNPTAIMIHPESCARYVECRTRNTLLGNYQEECSYPELFDSFNNSCKHYREVKCGNRPEPKAPCDYKKMQICADPKGTCPPCELDNPSCVGKRDGPQAIPNKPEYFMHCKDERTISVTQCPPTAPTFDVVTGSCTVTLNPLEPEPYCQANPTAVVPHPDNCAQYIDCRQKNTPLGGYRHECPYPKLVSDTDKIGTPCQSFDTVQCGNRPEPKNPCDYEQNLICSNPLNCPPCEDRFPGCYGIPDGNHPFPEQPDKYIVCYKGRTIKTETCPLGQFDPIAGSCTVRFDPVNPQAYCNLNPTAKMLDDKRCAMYYDCSRPESTFDVAYKHECPYPKLYSETTQSCESFEVVDCGSRFVAVEPCDYYKNRCSSPGDPNCEACEKRLPSCHGFPNGNHPFPDRPNSYITCYQNRTINIMTCEKGLYDPGKGICVEAFDPANPSIYCRLRPNAKVGHFRNCAQYYDCSIPSGRFGAYLNECQYPQLFNDKTGTCVVFTASECGTKFIPQSPCEYQQNQCSSISDPNCEPCEQRLPSCIMKSDGNNTITGRELTPDYIVCFMNRTVSVETCPAGFFDGSIGECRRTINAATIRAFCVANSGVIRANPVNCAQYFDCGEASIRARTFLRECPYPMLFDAITNTCKNYTDVVCGTRREYTAPCDYLQNRCNPTIPNCRPCTERFASCVGLPDGMHPHPNRTMSSDYVICHRGRTVSVEKCIVGLFDPGSRMCTMDITEEMIRSHCRLNPNLIQPHLYQCAQYFDCGEPIGGSNLRECKYPQLFDLNTMQCQNFTEVTCGTRIEPQAPCDYLQNHCPPNVTNCVPCEDRLPSCRNLNDGNNAYPGRPVSEYYINCFKNRTVSVEACQVSRYDPARRKCSSTIDSGVLTKFCQDNPKMVIPDPDNCARFYNCSDPSIVRGLDEPYKQECKYPRLFGQVSLGCQLFTMVRCQKNRYVPKTPCEYVENQCFNSTCEACETRFPSCVGKVDGSNEFPGRENTEYYIVCYRERTVAIVSCTIGTYSHADRACVGEMQNTPDTAAAAGGTPPIARR